MTLVKTSPIAELYYRLLRPRTLAIWAFDRFFDRLMDRRFGINSSNNLPLSLLRLKGPHHAESQPISYFDFAALMKAVVPRGVFIDYGSGAGRCVCLASQYPFELVIGVESSEPLCVTARQNIKARRIIKAQIECVDATAFSIPPEATTFFFFNPFRGEIMRTVLANIVRSVEKHPRRVTVLAYGSPIDTEFFQQFQTVTSLRERRQIKLPTGCVGMLFEND